MAEKQGTTGAIYQISAALMFLSIAALAIGALIQINSLSKTIQAHLAETSAQQRDMQTRVSASSDLMMDVVAYGLEDQGTLSPTDANEIVGESIRNISARSERWGKIAKAINDSYLKGK